MSLWPNRILLARVLKPLTSSAARPQRSPVCYQVIQPTTGRHICTRSLPSSSLSRKYSVEAQELKEDQDVIRDEEKIIGDADQFEFQAETAELLNIVAKSLYSENEVFIREIISNASDALEKLRYNRLTSEGGVADDAPLEIHIRTNKYDNTFTIQDTGIGMTKEELVKNLGMIARSGSKAFLESMKEKGDASSSIIGQFGVGFYSTFMVGDKVAVYTKSHEQGSKGYSWTCEGGVSYKISEAKAVSPGTKIVVTLKPDCRKFAEDGTVEQIIKKHSTFVGFPVRLNGKVINTVQPLWTVEQKDISDEHHLNFFQYLSGNDHEHYLYKLFYKTDAPLNIRSIFYVAEERPTLLEMTQNTTGTSGVSLYSRKILVQHNTENLLPKWLRFLRGVVDSEDIPLNLSRELLQNSALIRKLRETITSRMIRFFLEQSRKDPEKYLKFHENYKMFITEGVLAEETQDKKEEVAQLLRYESSSLPAGEVTSLHDYVSRMETDQRNILYLCAPSRHLAETSPYFEAAKSKGLEVLFCFDAYDELMMLQLKTFDSKQLSSLENQAVVDQMKPHDGAKDESIVGSDSAEIKLSSSDGAGLASWAKLSLDEKVTDVKLTDKLDKHPAMVTVWEMGSVRHFIKSQYLTNPKGLSDSEKIGLFKPTLQLNSSHPVVMKLSKLRAEDEDLAKLVLEQLYDNAMVSAGLIEDARPMVNRLNSLLSKVLEKH
ncbi:heat shock protein 75 kDa, mitochondrial-like isoform X2 [Clavelina lepadiformis]|uniref:heat shock protein 75 kDa, mitochondrial-like isoform X2 n=1 Tax=Clavelina lepadiformis TaxID=159417 RepID=UPI0040425E05